MYERNAIILERYFNQMFGYNMRSNIKTNFRDYCELVECLEKYKQISEEEENVIQEYDSIANKIREIQKNQGNISKKSRKLIEEINNIFQNIDEDIDSMKKKITNVNASTQEINKSTQENEELFVNTISAFNEKSKVRIACSRSRRNIENEYNKKINKMLDNYREIDVNCEKKARQFIETNTEGLEKDLKIEMKKNGEKEKIPFNTNVIVKAITLSVDVQKRETDIYAGIYEKTSKLFTEIKNNTVKIDKHKKMIKDSKCKVNFLASIKEYLVQFLDYERLTSVNEEEEHDKLMIEACKNLDEDVLQINNLYTLLLKEISKKITKKSYSELYNYTYLEKLEYKIKEFDQEIKKLNLPVTIINPNHWRIEGMKKIYETFNKCVIDEYDRDLSEYIPQQETKKEEEVVEKDEIEIKEIEKQEEDNKSVKDPRTEIDRKIDIILGLSNGDDYNDDWEEDDEEEDEDSNHDNGKESKEEELDDEWDDEKGQDDEKKFDDKWDDDEDDDEKEKDEDKDIEDKWSDKEDKEDQDDGRDTEDEDGWDEEDDDNEKDTEDEDGWDEEDDDDNDNEKDTEDKWDDEDNDQEKDFDDNWDEEEPNDQKEEFNDDWDDWEYEDKTKDKSKYIDFSDDWNENKENGENVKSQFLNNKKTKNNNWEDDYVWEDENEQNENNKVNAEKKQKRRERTEEDWENAFIKIKKKNAEKKKGFFDKFKK